MLEFKSNMYIPFRHDGTVKESMLNSPSSNLLDSTSTGWPFATTFSTQSGSNPVFHHSVGSIQGLHNVHGNYSMPTMPTSISSCNSGFGGLPSGGVHQPSGSLSTGRFASNNLPVPLSQLTHGGLHGHTGITNRGGSGVSPLKNNAGPRITSSAGNIMGGAAVAGGSLGRAINLGAGQSPVSGSTRAGTGGIGVQGPGRPLNSVAQQASTQVSLLGSTFSSSLGAANSGQTIMGNGHQVSMGVANDLNSNDSAPFDINDFPQLTSRPNSSGGAQGQLASIRKQGLSVNSLAQQNQEFSIQNEDFPALPGFKGGNVDFTMDLHQKDHHENALALMQSHHYQMGRSAGFSLGGSYASHQQQQQQQQEIRSGLSTNSAGGSFEAIANSADLMHLHGSDLFPSTHGQASYHSQVVPGLRSGVPPNIMPGIGSYDHLLQQYHHHHNHSQFRHVTSVNPPSKEHMLKSMHGIQGAPDAFGLLGLLSVIRMSEPDLTTLALGIDLTTLGLNLNSRDNLYRTFASPWANGPAKGEPEYTLPQCYSQQAPRLQPGYFAKFSQETLFYIFYSMPNDEAQLFAASELYRKGWFYHKELRLWLIHVPHIESLVKTNTYERGSYIFFDPNQWDIGQKDNYVLHYEMVEKKPQLSQAPEL